MSDPKNTLALRVHDECNGSKSFFMLILPDLNRLGFYDVYSGDLDSKPGLESLADSGSG